MITVRFSTGFSIQYNNGGYIDRDASGFTRIYKRKGEGFIAQVPTSQCVVEFATPCRMYQSVEAESEALLALTKEIRSLKRKLGVKP